MARWKDYAKEEKWEFYKECMDESKHYLIVEGMDGTTFGADEFELFLEKGWELIRPSWHEECFVFKRIKDKKR